MNNSIRLRYLPDITLAAIEQYHPTNEWETTFIGAFFDNPDLDRPVSLRELRKGETHVILPSDLKGNLRASIVEQHPDWSPEVIQIDLIEKLEELSRTPPIGWIQPNSWPVHGGDFCEYIGEWTITNVLDHAQNQDPGEFLRRILDYKHLARRRDIQSLLRELELDVSLLYVFKSRHDGRYVAVDQSM